MIRSEYEMKEACAAGNDPGREMHMVFIHYNNGKQSRIFGVFANEVIGVMPILHPMPEFAAN